MTVPYLINYTAYEYEGDQCKSIDDMVSISLQQQVPISNIVYNIGSLDDVSIPLLIKNLTTNTNLEVTILFDKNVFAVDGQRNINKKTITLNNGQTQQFTISLNKNSLNESIRKLQSNITLTVKNITNGTIVTRNAPVQLLDINLLEDTVPTST